METRSQVEEEVDKVDQSLVVAGHLIANEEIGKVDAIEGRWDDGDAVNERVEACSEELDGREARRVRPGAGGRREGREGRERE